MLSFTNKIIQAMAHEDLLEQIRAERDALLKERQGLYRTVRELDNKNCELSEQVGYWKASYFGVVNMLTVVIDATPEQVEYLQKSAESYKVDIGYTKEDINSVRTAYVAIVKLALASLELPEKLFKVIIPYGAIVPELQHRKGLPCGNYEELEAIAKTLKEKEI